MITNTVKRIDQEIIEVPIIIRSEQSGWIPTFDIWATKIDKDTSYIDCTQNFQPQIKIYSIEEIDSKIGHFDNNILVIYWKTLIDSNDLSLVHKVYNGKLRATCWQERYCTYFGNGSDMPWLHSVILGLNEPNYVIHHIDCASVDNRRQNLHFIPKSDHTTELHPPLNERKKMFFDPDGYCKEDKEQQMAEFVRELSMIGPFYGKADFIAKFAKENMELAKEILELAKLYINLSRVKSGISKNRMLNTHLKKDYLDAYEIKKYLKRNVPKTKTEGQTRLF